MQALLFDTDAMLAVAQHMTREEAGLLLAPLCKAGATFVRGADDAAMGGSIGMRSIGDPWKPMIDLDTTCKRIERKYGPGDNRLLLELLATEIALLTKARVCELVFCLSAARAGQRPSLLGCHLLRLIEPKKFWCLAMLYWIPDELPHLLNSTSETVVYKGTAFQTVFNLFCALGLKRQPGPLRAEVAFAVPAQVLQRIAQAFRRRMASRARRRRSAQDVPI